MDCADEVLRRRNECAFNEEVQYFNHVLQKGHTLYKLKLNQRNVNLARHASKFIKGRFIVEVPITGVFPGHKVYRKDIEVDASPAQNTDPWTAWNEFRMHADFHHQVRLALDLTADLPTEEELKRWIGEPIEYIIVSVSMFVQNSYHFPVLPQKYQQVIRRLLKVCRNFLVRSNPDRPHSNLYAEYLQNLVNTTVVNEYMVAGNDDVLQVPLQPLYDNLDASTYEIFETDPIKYKLYQEAIELALQDKVPEAERKDRTVVIMIVGAGRGPLVRATVNASANTKIKVKIYVVEKNPNAVVTLQANMDEIWDSNDITLFCHDMRDFNPAEKADILVSELLGSFGDNELSPECLDGAQRYLKEDGISIPQNSVSFVNPVMSSKLYNACRSLDRMHHPRDRNATVTLNFDCTYVVYPKNCYHIANPQKAFTFVHPNRETPIDNSRFTSLKFEASIDTVLHGFCGYFESTLYKHIKMSIHPFTHTNGMFSWFAFYFPISEPQFVKAGQTIEFNLWRCVAPHQVWYEWSCSQPNITHIHNANARSCVIMK